METVSKNLYVVMRTNAQWIYVLVATVVSNPEIAMVMMTLLSMDAILISDAQKLTAETIIFVQLMALMQLEMLVLTL
jgi:hypothetical protein